MKYVYWIFGIMLGLAALVGILQYVASERVEVVELHTVDEEGEPVTTRLWVVDDEGFAYLRSSGEASGWYNRIMSNGEFELTRNGETGRYRAEIRLDKNDRINELMQSKYTWGNVLIGFLVPDRGTSIPIELHRL